MLVPALPYKQEIESKFARLLYSDMLFFYNGYAPCHEIPEIGIGEDGKYEWAIVDEHHRLIGYFTYFVNSYVDTVERFGLISFSHGNCTVTLDALGKMEELVKQHRRTVWCCISGNPAERVYRKFCRRHNGFITTMHDCTKDEHGEYHHSYTYEILNGGTQHVS